MRNKIEYFFSLDKFIIFLQKMIKAILQNLTKDSREVLFINYELFDFFI